MLCHYVLLLLLLPATALVITQHANPQPLSSLPTPTLVFSLNSYARNVKQPTSASPPSLLNIFSADYKQNKWANCASCFFVHSKVLSNNLSASSGTIEIDANLQNSETLTNENIYLSMGLNNHFTPGYYWARSSGLGASMEAPGYSFNPQLGTLSRVYSNSNDGKRSEWCDFLVKDDQIQLAVDTDFVEAVNEGLKKMKKNNMKVKVVSNFGVKLGAEPRVVADIDFVVLNINE